MWRAPVSGLPNEPTRSPSSPAKYLVDVDIEEVYDLRREREATAFEMARFGRLKEQLPEIVRVGGCGRGRGGVRGEVNEDSG